MKNRKNVLLFLAVASFCLSGCANLPFADKLAGLPLVGNLFKEKDQGQQLDNNTYNQGEHSTYVDEDDDDDTPPVEHTYVETIGTEINSVAYNHRYILRIDEEPINLAMKIKAPTPVESIDADKKLFTWENLNEDIIKLEMVEDASAPTMKAKVSPLKAGNAKIKVVNDYDKNFEFYFEIKVVDIKSTDYLWRFSDSKIYYCLDCGRYVRVSETHKTGNTTYCPNNHKLTSNFKKPENNQFNDCEYKLNAKGDGLVFANEKQPGLASGHAYLDDVDWYFERSRADANQTTLNSARSDKNALTIGKGPFEDEHGATVGGAENFLLRTT